MFGIAAPRRFPLRISFLLVFILLQAAALALQPALNDYQARLAGLKAQIPAVTASAQQAAETFLAHPEAQLCVPYWEQMSFAEEMINRSGGLALAGQAGGTGRASQYNFVLLSVRSWEKNAELMRRRVKEYQAKGWMVTVIGSKAGCPKNLGADFFIDNGAPSGKASLGRINVLANVTLGWMWCCEYAAALSRHGKFPAILQSICIPGGPEYDRSVQSAQGRHSLVDSPTAIPAGELSALYLQRVDRLMADLQSERIQGQLVQVADIVARRMAAGGRVGIAGMGHVQIEEVMVDNQAPWAGLRGVGMPDLTFTAHLDPGDLLVWMSYNGMNSLYDDYAKYIVASGVDLIPCFAPDPIWSQNTPPHLALLEQSWTLPDAEVPIPVFPDFMAPVSGINVTLLARMLDDEVAARLQGKNVKPVPAKALPPEFCDRGAEGYFLYGGSAPEAVRRWGLVDERGRQVAPMRYDAVGPVSEGMAAVQVKGKWGYVNTAGKLAIPAVYDEANGFSQGVALVGKDGKYGYINKAGQAVVPLEYDRIEDPMARYGSFRRFARFFGVPELNYVLARKGDRWAVLSQGKLVLPVQYEAISAFSEKCAAVRAGKAWGLVDLAGKEVIPPKFSTIGRYRRGYATVRLGGKVGAIDGEGREIVPPIYEDIAAVNGDAVVVRVGKLYGVVSRSGKELIPSKYEEVGRFSTDLVPVRIGKLWGAIDAAGREAAPVQYEEIRRASEGLTPVALDGKWGFLDQTGAPAILPQYDDADDFENGMAFVTLNGARRLIDAQGAEIALPRYDYLTDAGEGLFKVARGGKWGFIDRTGKEIVPPQYSYVLGFTNGHALVARGGQWREDYGKAPILIGAKWGLVDKTGRELIAPTFDRIAPAGAGLFPVARNVEVMKPIP
ncbi:MAG: WG repeat-containing protein [Armatimonadota bacterium]